MQSYDPHRPTWGANPFNPFNGSSSCILWTEDAATPWDKNPHVCPSFGCCHRALHRGRIRCIPFPGSLILNQATPTGLQFPKADPSRLRPLLALSSMSGGSSRSCSKRTEAQLLGRNWDRARLTAGELRLTAHELGLTTGLESRTRHNVIASWYDLKIR